MENELTFWREFENPPRFEHHRGETFPAADKTSFENEIEEQRIVARFGVGTERQGLKIPSSREKSHPPAMPRGACTQSTKEKPTIHRSDGFMVQHNYGDWRKKRCYGAAGQWDLDWEGRIRKNGRASRRALHLTYLIMSILVNVTCCPTPGALAR